MHHAVTRRQLLGQTALAGVAASLISPANALGQKSSSQEAATNKRSLTAVDAIRYCLNTSTIRGQQLPLAEEVRLTAAAGYDGIEPWMREIEQHRRDGHSLSDLKKQIRDAGLTVDSAIGFAHWIVDDDEQRAKGIESLKRDMDLVRQIGGTRIAAPPVGATNQTDLDLFKSGRTLRDDFGSGATDGCHPPNRSLGLLQIAEPARRSHVCRMRSWRRGRLSAAGRLPLVQRRLRLSRPQIGSGYIDPRNAFERLPRSAPRDDF